MTRKSQKDEERFYAEEYLRRREFSGLVSSNERPDFLINSGGKIIGVEVVSYGDRRGREVDAAWDVLIGYSAEFRRRNPDLNRFGVRLHFRNYRIPPPRDYDPFCEAIAVLLRKQVDLPTRGRWRTVDIEKDDEVLGVYLAQIEVYGVTFYSDWEWPTLMNGGIGTSDEEMLAAISRKLREYQQPNYIEESHLVVHGRGPQRTRIVAPFSVEQLNRFPLLNAALRAGPFAAAAILCLRDFYWVRGNGWRELP